MSPVRTYIWGYTLGAIVAQGLCAFLLLVIYIVTASPLTWVADIAFPVVTFLAAELLGRRMAGLAQTPARFRRALNSGWWAVGPLAYVPYWLAVAGAGYGLMFLLSRAHPVHRLTDGALFAASMLGLAGMTLLFLAQGAMLMLREDEPGAPEAEASL